jgi:hypothetical protein
MGCLSGMEAVQLGLKAAFANDEAPELQLGSEIKT